MVVLEMRLWSHYLVRSYRKEHFLTIENAIRIPLNRFDECIDDAILKRGLTCFRNGQVCEPEECGPGEFEAVVEDTEPYTVHLVIDHGEVVEHLCSCPYDAGPVCKHVAAVLFSLQKEVLGFKKKKKPAKSDGPKKPSKRITVAARVDAMLENVDPGDLRQFVREQASQDVRFRNFLLASFATPDSGESKSYYTQQLSAILRSHKDRGYIGWSASNRVARGVQNILQMAKNHFEARHIREGLVVCMAVMEKMVGALQYSDDSDGSIGGCINDAYDMMLAIARSNPAASIKKLLLDYGMKAIDKRLYAGWDWHVGMMRMAAALVENAEEAGALLALLDREHGNDYSGKTAQAIKYELLAKTSGEKAADAWLEANLGIRSCAGSRSRKRWIIGISRRRVQSRRMESRKTNRNIRVWWSNGMTGCSKSPKRRMIVILSFTMRVCCSSKVTEIRRNITLY